MCYTSACPPQFDGDIKERALRFLVSILCHKEQKGHKPSQSSLKFVNV